MNLLPLIATSLLAFNWFGDGKHGSRFEAVAAMRQWIRDGGTVDYFHTKKKKKWVEVSMTRNEIQAAREREIQRLKKIAIHNWCYNYNASKYGFDTCKAGNAIGHLRKGEISFEDDWINSIRQKMVANINISKKKLIEEEYDHKIKKSRDKRTCKEEKETSQFICFRTGENKVIKRFRW